MEKTKLTSLERRIGFEAGMARAVFALEHGLRLEPGRFDLGIESHVLGALGELALAKHLGRFWSPLVGGLDTEVGDVGAFQVKAITREGLSLIVRDHDPGGSVYVQALVSFPGPVVTLTGWVLGSDAKQPEFWLEAGSKPGIHRSAFFVPLKALKPIGTLPA